MESAAGAESEGEGKAAKKKKKKPAAKENAEPQSVTTSASEEKKPAEEVVTPKPTKTAEPKPAEGKKLCHTLTNIQSEYSSHLGIQIKYFTLKVVKIVSIKVHYYYYFLLLYNYIRTLIAWYFVDVNGDRRKY